MTINQQTIGGYTGSNVPGVLSLYLFDRKDVLSVVDPFRHPVAAALTATISAGAVVFNRGAVATKMKFPPLGCSMIQTMERTDGGMVSKCVIALNIPASRKDVMDYYAANYQKQFVALVEDANRQAYVVGNEERGLMMSLVQTVNAVNDHSLTFSGNFNYPALNLETSGAGLVLADHFRDTDFSIDFSLDFNA